MMNVLYIFILENFTGIRYFCRLIILLYSYFLEYNFRSKIKLCEPLFTILILKNTELYADDMISSKEFIYICRELIL